FQAAVAGQAVTVPLGIKAQPLHAQLFVTGLQVVLPASVGRVDDGKWDQPVAVRLDLGRHFLIAGLGVAVGDGTGAGNDRPVDLLAVHQRQQRRGRVVTKLPGSVVSQVSIDIEDHDLPLFMSFAMFAPRIFSLSGALRLAARSRPTLAVRDISQPNTSRSTPSTRAAISTTPSSVTLPLVSRETLGAWRRALIVHSQ